MTAEPVRTRHRHRHSVPMSPVERRPEAPMVSETVVSAPVERELASAPTVPAEAAMGKAAMGEAMAGKAAVEAVPEMMCKGVAAESVPAEAATTESAFAMFVTAVVGPTEPASVTPSSMCKFVAQIRVPP